MEDISVMVWNELNRFVGTAEQVFIRRRRSYLNDMIDTKAVCFRYPVHQITSGSRAEGLSLQGSDLDYMYVWNDISVSCLNNVSIVDRSIIMDTTNIKPGFVRLYCHESFSDVGILSSALIETKNGLVLSSLLFRDEVVRIIQRTNPNAKGHGPCSSLTLVGETEGDMLLCFSCKTWPFVAAKWNERYRNNNWPQHDLITEILYDGCLIVPIGNPHSRENHMEWRISFSTAEKKLVHSMNHTQFLCYGLLKLYLKHVINSNTEVNDLFCSYFLKTCLFYCIEEENIIWNKESILDCFWTCFRRLMKWVRDEYCPNYFIKDNNMFEGKICGKKGRILLRYLSELYHEGNDSLLRIPCLSKLHISLRNRPVLTDVVLTQAEKEYFCDTELLNYTIRALNKECLTIIRYLVINVELLQTSTNSTDKAILTIIYHKIIHHFVQMLYRHIVTNKSNKIIYKQKIQLKSFILLNCLNIDKCTGMLLLATLCYLNGEYKEVVTIVKKILKRLKSCIFYHGGSYLRVKKQAYIDRMCGKGLTLNQKLACNIYAQCYCCLVDFKFYPSEIEREVAQHFFESDRITYINPWVYSYMMLFLSYLHMDSLENMSNTLSELYITVDNTEVVSESEAPFAISLLERCIKLYKSWQNKQTDLET